MEMNPARKRRARSHHAFWCYPTPVPVKLTTDRERQLRRWGFAAGLAIVGVAATLSWAVTVWTHADLLGTPPSATISTPGHQGPGDPRLIVHTRH
jgi:hypothetical protein